MNARYPTQLLSIVLLFFGLLSLFACGENHPAPTEPPMSKPTTSNSNEEPIVQVIRAAAGPEPKKYTRSEEIFHDNCLFPDPKKKTVETSFLVSEATRFQVSGDLKASIPGIEARIGSAIENTYGMIKGERTSEELVTPPGYHYKYTVNYYEVWENGEITVRMGAVTFPAIPYERLISYGLESERQQLDCPSPEPVFTAGTQTTGTAPLSVQFTDQSKGYITNWQWDFGDQAGVSNAQSPIYIYNKPSYTYNHTGFCFEPNQYTVSLTVTNAQKSATAIKENFITVLPKEYTIQIQPEPYALKEGAGLTMLHLPGCSQVCALNFSGTRSGGACGTSVTSQQVDEIGYYFEGQQIGLQVSHEVQYCPPNTTSAIQQGIWKFDHWSEPFLAEADNIIAQGDHNPIFIVDKSLYIRVHYTWDRPCP